MKIVQNLVKTLNRYRAFNVVQNFAIFSNNFEQSEKSQRIWSLALTYLKVIALHMVTLE